MPKQPRHSGSLSPEMALLGLLFGEPGHGYDLHRKVIADLGQVWHLSQSQAYAILKRLELKGDISVQEIIQDKLPPKQLLHITAQGRTRFLDWIESTSGGSARAIRMEFVTRLYFLKTYMPEKLPRAIDRQRQETLAHFKRLEETLTTLPLDQIFNRLSLELRLKQLISVVEWLDDCQNSIEHASIK